jgi:hypothetical protein
MLDVASSSAARVVELARSSVEGIANGDVYVFVGMIVADSLARENLAPRRAEIDAHLERLTFVRWAVRSLDDHATRRYLAVQTLELCGFLAESGFDGG